MTNTHINTVESITSMPLNTKGITEQTPKIVHILQPISPRNILTLFSNFLSLSYN
jgi:hypothetical protein